MAHDVFLSYATEDKAIADAAVAFLESKKVRCWVAPRDVLPGRPYAEALSDAIAGSHILVLVLSSHSNVSGHVAREVEAAVSRGLPVIPLRVEDVRPAGSLTYFIGSVHWLDALTPPLEAHLGRLAETVRVLLDRPATADEDDSHSEPDPVEVRRTWFTPLAVVTVLVVVTAAFVVWWRQNPPVVPDREVAEVQVATAELANEVRDLRTRLADVSRKSEVLANRVAALPPGGNVDREQVRIAATGLEEEVKAVDRQIEALTRRRAELTTRVNTNYAQRDAEAMAKVLREQGYDVSVELTNVKLQREEIEQVFKKIGRDKSGSLLILDH